jgi:LuxR family maltose regulon positive regulatory protein
MLLCCAGTVVNAARGDGDAARLAVTRTEELAPAVEPSLPWVAGLRAVLNASACVDLGDFNAARRAREDARRALAMLPDLPLFDRILVGVDARQARAAVPARLTPAERRVAEHIDSPLSGAAIAAELGVSPETVKSHLGSIYRKLGASSRQEAAEVLRGDR